MSLTPERLEQVRYAFPGLAAEIEETVAQLRQEIDHLRAALAARPTRAEVLEEVAGWLAEVGEHDTAHLLRHVEDLFPASAPDADGGAR